MDANLQAVVCEQADALADEVAELLADHSLLTVTIALSELLAFSLAGFPEEVRIDLIAQIATRMHQVAHEETH